MNFASLTTMTIPEGSVSRILRGAEILWAKPSAGLLPAAYQQVEYIESTGTQYILTDVVNNAAYDALFDMEFTKTGARNLTGHGSTAGYYFGVDANGIYELGGGLVMTGVSGVTRNLITVNSASALKITVNGTSRSRALGNGSPAAFRLLGGWTSLSMTCKAKLYRAQFWRDGSLIRDYVPCYRKSDNVAGLYELVAGVFHTNKGSGSFVVGADVVE